MSAILILYILVLGYCYVEKTPTEKNKLKRGSNWEAYAILLKHGLFCMLFSAFLALIPFMLFAIILLKFYNNFVDCLFNTYWIYKKTLSSYWQIVNSVFGTIVFICGWGYLVAREKIVIFWRNNEYVSLSKDKNSKDENNGLQLLPKKEKESLLKQLKNQDGLLWIALEAMEKNTTVKISLKSKKIYVGMVHGEQFERMDFDNLIILPYLSGYRDKDTLKVKFDVNYADFYHKDEQFNSEKWYENEVVANFQLSIRVSEIESISFFDVDVFNKMQKNAVADQPQAP